MRRATNATHMDHEEIGIDLVGFFIHKIFSICSGEGNWRGMPPPGPKIIEEKM